MDLNSLLTSNTVLSVINLLTAIISKIPFSRREKKAIAAAAERLVQVASTEDVLRYDPKAEALRKIPARKKRLSTAHASPVRKKAAKSPSKSRR